MKNTNNKTILILAGGTGGHVIPALAVAERLKEEGCKVAWLGTKRGIEASLVPPTGIPLEFIDIQGIRGKGWYGYLTAPFRIFKAIRQAYNILKHLRPRAVLSMGGYAAGPGGVAALLLRIPLMIHEQNAIPGTTNRLLARYAKQILVSFPGVFAVYGSKVVYAGNPIRMNLLQIPPPQERFKVDAQTPVRLLVLGGSQGAQALNTLVPEALALMSNEPRITIVHQCGNDKLPMTQALYAKTNRQVEICTYIEDMAVAYEQADILIARSGALTVSEIAAIGIPSILVPFPYAIDDHQTKNARFLSEHGGALLMPQDNLTPKTLAQALEDLIRHPDKRLAMAEVCRKLGKPFATSVVAEHCKEVIHG